MFKEIKYLIYLIVIVLIFIFSIRYYISDDYKKKYFRGLESHQNKICLLYTSDAADE